MLDKLEMFIAVSREKHFGRAAESLGITQPTLSTGIRQLEEQLGAQLIFRAHRFGSLTPEGKAALVWARRIVGDTRQLKDEMRNARHGLSGHLRMAVIPTALTWASRLTTHFCTSHPDVRFTVLSKTSGEILQMLESLEADVGLSYLDNEPLGRVSSVPIYNERYRLVCANDGPFPSDKPVNWKDLDGHNLCLLTPDMQNRRIIDASFAQAGIRPKTTIESNSTIALVANVAEGGWMTILPEDMAQFLIRGKPMRSLPLVGPSTKHLVGLVAPYREPHTPVLAALLRAAGKLAQIN